MILLLNNKIIPKDRCDLFQRPLRRLRHKEIRKDTRSETEAPKEKVPAPSNGDNHLRDDNTNDEICDPDGCRGQSNTLSTFGIWEDFCRERPGERSIGTCVAEDVDV
jgi:hypothetical protein